MSDDDADQWSVVVNAQGQYSIWPAERPLPPGWDATGPRGSREQCLAHVAEVWTDLRPLDVRAALRAKAQVP